MTVKISYDREADAAWIKVGEAGSVETVPATESINLDFDADGHLVAIEVLNVSKTAPALASGGSDRAIAAE